MAAPGLCECRTTWSARVQSLVVLVPFDPNTIIHVICTDIPWCAHVREQEHVIVCTHARTHVQTHSRTHARVCSKLETLHLRRGRERVERGHSSNHHGVVIAVPTTGIIFHIHHRNKLKLVNRSLGDASLLCSLPRPQPSCDHTPLPFPSPPAKS